MELETRNVFIDSCLYIAANYDYSSEVFSRFCALAQGGAIRPYTTSITKREVELHIREEVQNAGRAAKKFRKDAKILTHLNINGFEAVFRRLDLDMICQLQFEKFHQFIIGSHTQEIPISSGDIDTVFLRYFNQHKPFESRKKEEFPDAFNLSALEKWCEENNATIYVVSSDLGVQAACAETKVLLPLKTISEFIDLIVADEKTAMFRQAEEWLDEHIDWLGWAIAEEFLKAEFFIDDADGDVEWVRALDVKITDSSLLDVNTTSANWEFTVLIHVEAQVTYEDPSTGYWDKEDGAWYGREIISKRLVDEFETTADMAVMLTPGISDEVIINRIVLGLKQDIPLSVLQD